MPTLRFLDPLDQLNGSIRLLAWLADALECGLFSRCCIVAAFAKEGPLLRLDGSIRTFKKNKGSVEAIFGVDIRGTSRQALEYALREFNSTHLWHHPSPLVTFHAKVYLFEGASRGEIILGSNNLTVGGTETNCEAAIKMGYDLPSEAKGWNDARAFWDQLVSHPNCKLLDQPLLSSLVTAGLLEDESVPTPRIRAALGAPALRGKSTLFPHSPFPAPSPRPIAAGPRNRAPKARRHAPAMVIPNALLIQIVPHHNGEIFLSKSAVNQKPGFFEYPFTGRTKPKKRGNPPYPQRVPDPVVDFSIYDANGGRVRSLMSFQLNMVDYSRKSEIRITVPPDFARLIPPLSILHMSRMPSQTTLDYLCEVFSPGSAQHASLITACTEVMPSGGRASRRFGWI